MGKGSPGRALAPRRRLIDQRPTSARRPDASIAATLRDGTARAGYWNYESTDPAYVVNQNTVDEDMGIAGPYPGTAFMGVRSWLTPDKIGVGKLQPNARVQYADWAPTTRLVIDVGLAYVIDGFNHKYHLNYRHQETDPVDGESQSSDAIQLGLQYLMSN